MWDLGCVFLDVISVKKIYINSSVGDVKIVLYFKVMFKKVSAQKLVNGYSLRQCFEKLNLKEKHS